MAGTVDVTGQDSTSTRQALIKSTLNGLWSYLSSLIAGERIPGSASGSYLAVRQEANVSVISKTTAVTIGTGAVADTHLMGLMFTNALTGTCVVAGFADSDGAAQSITFPIGTVGFRDFFGAINSAGALTVTCSTAGDDNFCVVLWRPAV